jgi:hypothetical protein
MAKKQSSKILPAEQVRIGRLKAAIWKNEGANGAFYNVTFQRSYRTEDGKWENTASFGRDDLLVLAKIADAAHSRILRLLADQKPLAGAA